MLQIAGVSPLFFLISSSLITRELALRVRGLIPRLISISLPVLNFKMGDGSRSVLVTEIGGTDFFSQDPRLKSIRKG